MTKCIRCDRPAHASESDDEGIGLCCSAYTVDWHDGGMQRCESLQEAFHIAEARFPLANVQETAKDTYIYVEGPTDNFTRMLALIRRAVRS